MGGQLRMVGCRVRVWVEPHRALRCGVVVWGHKNKSQSGSQSVLGGVAMWWFGALTCMLNLRMHPPSDTIAMAALRPTRMWLTPPNRWGCCVQALS